MLLLVRVSRLASAPLASRVVLLGIARATAAEQRTTRDLKETMESTNGIELDFFSSTSSPFYAILHGKNSVGDVVKDRRVM